MVGPANRLTAEHIVPGSLRCITGEHAGPSTSSRLDYGRFRVTVQPLSDNVRRVASVVRNISEFKRLEAELQARAQEFRTLADNAPDMIIRYDTEARLLFLNRAAEHFSGVSLAEVRGKQLLEIAPEAVTASHFQSTILEVVRSGVPVTLEIAFGAEVAGEPAWHEVRFIPERDCNDRIVSVLTIGRDLTQIKQTEAKLREREQQFRTLAENLPDTIARVDRDSRYRYVNPAIENLTGIPAAAYPGTRVGELARQHGLLRDGDPVGDFPMAIVRTFEQGISQDLETQVMGRTGPRTLAFRIVPERNADGVIANVLSIARDITDIRTAEAALKQSNATLEARVATRTAELQEANRELEKFAYTVSHDLRTPLRAIDGFAHLIMENERARLSDEGCRMLERISSASIKLGRLIDDILEYSRFGQYKLALQAVDMTTLAWEIVNALQPGYPQTAVTVADMPEAYGDPTMLRQVFANLIGNALKFSARADAAHVSIGTLDEDGETIYYVTDNGIGFDTRHSDKLFGMFERLHAQLDYPGTGVGLAIVKRLIERQGGRVWAESQPGAGSTFYFTLT